MDTTEATTITPLEADGEADLPFQADIVVPAMAALEAEVLRRRVELGQRLASGERHADDLNALSTFHIQASDRSEIFLSDIKKLSICTLYTQSETII